MNPMVRRFKRGMWSATRTAIDAMAVGSSLEFPLSELSNAQVSAMRLREAYDDGRRWVVSKGETVVSVRRVS